MLGYENRRIFEGVGGTAQDASSSSGTSDC
jgi:hypothetical protein